MIRFVFFVFLMCVGFLNVVANDFESTKIYFKVENWSSLEVNISENVFEVTEQKKFFQNLSLLYKIKTIEKAFKTVDENLDKTYLITFENEKDKDNIIAILEKQYFTDYAEKIPIYSLFLTPNDPQFPTQWNLDNIQAELAWNITTGSANVVVAITDDAIAINHPDLDANIFTNPNEIPGNGIDDDNNGYIDDVNGWDAADNDNNPSPINANNDHGTHVAGITAAVTNNTTGIASIGFNVKILPVKIGTSPSGSLIGAFNGLDYAIHSGFAHVINMSWGGGSYSFTMQNLINAAFNANIVCVAAAGNSNTSAPMYPAAYNHVISVGATKDTDQRSVFSNYGNTIDVMAPGQAILSTITNNAYGVKSGTSMASPLVAGLCALIISNSQGISATQVETCLKNTCDNIDTQNPNFIGQIGAGRINAFQAVQCFNTPPTANFSINLQSICQNQNVQFTDLSYGTNITSWLWNFGDGNTSTLQNPSHTYTSIGPFTVSLTVTNAFGTDTKTETNYINTITPTAILSGSSNIVSGGNAYLQIQFTGNTPFSFVYSDGNTNFTETGISQNPYYFSVSPTANATYSLVSMADAGCAGNVSGNAIINMFTPSNPLDTSCTAGQFILQDNGHTEAQSIVYTDDGGYILAGFTTVSGAGQEDVFVTKFDYQNIIEWSKTYGTTSSDKGYPIYIAKTNTGCVVSSNSKAYASSLGALVIMSLDFSGNIVWQKKISSRNNYTNSRHISTDNQGNILVSGSNAINSAGTDDAYLMKLNALNGSLIWSTTFGTSQQDHSYNVIETDDGGYIYGSASHFFGNGLNAKLLVKVNSLGIFQWAKTYDNDYDEAFYDYKIGLDGNIYAVGIEGNNNSYSINVSKISQSGNLIWSKNYSGANNDIAGGIEILASGEFYISGFSNSFGNGNNDLFLTKLDAGGNEIWTKFYGGNANESYYYGVKNISINELENKIHLFLNSTSFGGNDLDPYIVITDLDGNSDCNTISANWTVTIETPTVANVTGTINNLGTINNSAYLVNPFLSTLDTICTTVCDTTPILPPTIICENKLHSDTICQGDSTQINLPNGSSFSWSPNYNISNPNTANPMLFPSVDTNYIVTYYNIDSCFIIDTVHIKVNPSANIQTSFSDTTICPGNCVSLNAQGGISYIWTPNTGLNNPNISNPTACPISSTQYVVSGTDSNGCSASDTLNINVLACCGAFADFSVSDSIICIGESISVFNYSIINPPATNSWTFNGASPLSSNLQNPTSITYNVPGVFQIQYVLADACGTDTVEKTIYVNDLPYLETANDTLLCDSATLVYDLGGLEISNYNYLWTPNTGLNFNDIANPSATINNSQQYIVTVTDEFTSCFKTDTVNITFQNLPTHFIQNVSPSFCLGDTLNLSSHFFFDSIVWNGNINETTIQFPIINDTLIYATGYLAECFISDTFLVRADTLPRFIFVSNDTTICLGDDVVLSANSIFPVEWNTSETSNDISVSPTINSLYFVNALNGFCSLSDSILVNVLTLPNITITAQDTACVNSTINLSASGGNSYVWTNADNLTGTNNTIALTTDTMVYVTGTDICTKTDSLNIYAVDSNQIFVTADDTICEGTFAHLMTVSNASVLWNTNETTNSITSQLFINTIFTATTTAAYCPNVSDNVEVIVIPFPNLNVTSPIEVTQGEIVILEASGANNYFWSPSEGLSCITCENPSFTANENIVYYVSSQIFGCKVSDSIIVKVSSLDECIVIPTAFTPNNDGMNDKFYPIFKINDVEITQFRIYNRWGEEIHNGDYAWNGQYKNKDQGLEVYIYYIKYTCNNEAKQLIGNVTLIR